MRDLVVVRALVEAVSRLGAAAALCIIGVAVTVGLVSRTLVSGPSALKKKSPGPMTAPSPQSENYVLHWLARTIAEVDEPLRDSPGAQVWHRKAKLVLDWLRAEGIVAR